MSAAPGYSGAGSVNSIDGVINGSLTFGRGSDLLYARYHSSGLATGVTGSVDGGAGTDHVVVDFNANAAVASRMALPTNFETYSLAPQEDITVTLRDGFSSVGTLLIEGEGTIRNETTLSGAGLLLSSRFTRTSPSFVNAGSIINFGGTAGSYAIDFQHDLGRFENTGTISSAIGGLYFSSYTRLINSGSITAVGTAVEMFRYNVENSGTIRSTSGTGLILRGGLGVGGTNSGSISGATIGVDLTAGLINTGTIYGAQTGVQIGQRGVLLNLAGATVGAGAIAVSTTTNGYGVSVVNGGTINGDVNIAGNEGPVTPISGFGGNRYFALPGGVLNGNLTLGQDDTLIAYLSGAPAGSFPGINGTVSANNSFLRYRVTSDGTSSLAAPGGFSNVAFDLYDGATATLTGTTGQTLYLAGIGAVDMAGTIDVRGVAAIMLAQTIANPGEESLQNALDITNSGTITLIREASDPSPYAAVRLGLRDSFTNSGTLTVIDRAPNPYRPLYAIANAPLFTNSGTITLAGTVGVYASDRFVNTGSIVQLTGGGLATGVRRVAEIENSGTIEVEGTAIEVGYDTRSIVNSGRIASTGGIAISPPQQSSTTWVSVINQAGGTIEGATGQSAIRLSRGLIDNAGSILGSVDLGYSPYGSSYGESQYIARGGTITGDLTFGSGYDTFVSLGDDDGVSGIIDGGLGNDTYVRAREASGDVVLGFGDVRNFEWLGVRALGEQTTLTVVRLMRSTPMSSTLVTGGS